MIFQREIFKRNFGGTNHEVSKRGFIIHHGRLSDDNHFYFNDNNRCEPLKDVYFSEEKIDRPSFQGGIHNDDRYNRQTRLTYFMDEYY